MASVRGVSTTEEAGGARGGVEVEVEVEVEAKLAEGCVEEDEEDEAIGGLEGVFVADGVGVEGVSSNGPMFSFNSPNSFHSSISVKSYGNVSERLINEFWYWENVGHLRTPITMPILTKPGSFLFPARLPQSIRAFSSVATSRA